MDTLYEKVSETIDENSDKYLDFLKDICGFETNSANKKSINAMLDFITAYEADKEYKTKRKEFSKSGDVLCIDYSSNADKMICISAHGDTVYNKGDFGYPPIKIEGDYIYGPGVSDCKGGIAVGLLAMASLKENGFSGADIRFLIQSDEEVSSCLSNKGTISYIAECAKDSIAFLNLETKRKGQLVTQRKGIVTARFDITGKKVHSKDVDLGINAISEASFKIAELSHAKLKDTISFNCGIINGGTASNVVPDKCSFTAEARFASENEYDMVISYFKELANKTFIEGAKTELIILNERVPMEYREQNMELFRKVNRISEDYGFGTLTPILSSGGSDASDVSKAGIPVVDGLGIEGGKYHSTEEYAKIKSLSESAKFLAAVIIELSGAIKKVK